MALPSNAVVVCRFLTSAAPVEDWEMVSASDTGGVIVFDAWTHPTIPEPTEQEITDAANDLTVIDGQTFSQWLEEHGGDALKTLRRKAREALADNAQASAAVDRAIVIELLTYCRHIAKNHNDLLAWLGTQTTLQNRAQLNGFVAVEPTNQEARDAIVGRINAGEADS